MISKWHALQYHTTGVEDSSGLKFTYTSEPQRHRAGILTVGFSSNNRLIIPPGRDNYVVNGICPGSCTQKVIMHTQYAYPQAGKWLACRSLITIIMNIIIQFFPPEGITVFGNMLHTHLAGITQSIQHDHTYIYLHVYDDCRYMC